MSICVRVANWVAGPVIVPETTSTPPECPNLVLLSNERYIEIMAEHPQIDATIAIEAYAAGLMIAAIPTVTLIAVSIFLKQLKR